MIETSLDGVPLSKNNSIKNFGKCSYLALYSLFDFSSIYINSHLFPLISKKKIKNPGVYVQVSKECILDVFFNVPFHEESDYYTKYQSDWQEIREEVRQLDTYRPLTEGHYNKMSQAKSPGFGMQTFDNGFESEEEDSDPMQLGISTCSNTWTRSRSGSQAFSSNKKK